MVLEPRLIEHGVNFVPLFKHDVHFWKATHEHVSYTTHHVCLSLEQAREKYEISYFAPRIHGCL